MSKRVCLGMPGYGDVSAASARAFWLASRGGLEVDRRYNEGSLLAQNFNALWAWALSLAHQGEPPDYFAMLHSDVEPMDGWLDVMVAELEAHELDVLGAVVPIKDPIGLTSIALHRHGDNWSPLCRLTMREVFNLPETFTVEDTGHPILINTGCWVCKFDYDWCKEMHFTVNDRIVFNTTKKIWVAQVEPEDWYFSRLCHELNLRVGATRAVRLGHRGQTTYTNAEPWGDEFDQAYATESLIEKPCKHDVNFPYEVDGWLSPEEGFALAELAAGKFVLEIGSYCGKSTICLAQTAAHVDTVDTHDGRGTPRPKDTSHELRANLERYGLSGKVTTYTGTAQSVDWQSSYDLVFIDGAHDLESVRADIEVAQRVLGPDGLIAFHDFRQKPGDHDGRWDPAVNQAVVELIAQGGEFVSHHATVAVVKPPLPILMET